MMHATRWPHTAAALLVTALMATLLTALSASAVMAEPPEGEDGPPARPGAQERRGPPGGPDGQRRGPPSPERMIEHAMTFDADGDGKLDRSELTKFAEELHAMRMRGGPNGPGGGAGRGPGRGGPGGPGGPAGPAGRDNPADDGDRPERPSRPE